MAPRPENMGCKNWTRKIGTWSGVGLREEVRYGLETDNPVTRIQRTIVVCCPGTLSSSSKLGLRRPDCIQQADSLRRTSVTFQDRSETRLPFRPRESSPLSPARPQWVPIHPRVRNDPERMLQLLR